MKDKVSVFIAAYSKTNGAWLAETIASIREQGIDPQVEYDEGLTANRWTKAIEDCKTEYLHLAHHDDVYLPGFYDETVAWLDAHPEAPAVFTLDYIISEKGHRVGQTTLPFPLQDSYDYTFVFNNMSRYGNFLRCPSVVLRVDKVKGLSYPPTECGTASDTGFWFRALTRGPIGIVPKKLFKYRQSSSSDTHANVLGSDKQYDHLRAMRFALDLHPHKELIDWDQLAILTKQIKRLEEYEDDKRLQAKAANAKDIEFVVVHEAPFNAGTGVLAGDRVCRRNRDDGESITYYVYPTDADRISIGYERGCPVVKCPPYAFEQAVANLKPTLIEFMHTLRWPLDILRKREGIRQELYLHDSHLWCARYHMVNDRNEVCDGPSEVRCYHCAGVSPADYQARRDELAKLLPGLDAIHANSEYTRSMVPKDYPPVDVHEFAIPELPLYAKRKRIGYFGYFNPTKGVHVLLQAMLRVTGAQLLLFCEAPEDLRDGKGLYGFENVLVLGSYERRDLPKLAALCDLAVSSSLNESFGITARELRMLGLPLVATKVGGMDSIGTVPGNDVEALAKAIQEAVDAG